MAPQISPMQYTETSLQQQQPFVQYLLVPCRQTQTGSTAAGSIGQNQTGLARVSVSFDFSTFSLRYHSESTRSCCPLNLAALLL